MTTQTLKAFQSVFSTDVVRIEFDDFPRDGAFGKQEVIDALKEQGIDAIYLQPKTSAAQANFEASVANINSKNGKDLHNLYARYVAPSWMNDDGTAMGTADEVGQLRADFVAALFFKLTELSGGNKAAVDDAKND